MKKLRKVMVLVLTLAMVLTMGLTAFAEPTPHSITITNTNSSISIDGKTYNAYKLFDSTKSGDAYAYYMSTSSQFYSETLVSGTPAEGSLAAVLKKYFKFTALSGDSSKVSVTPLSDNLDARALADELQKFLANLDADKTGTANGETCTITLDNDAAGQGYYIVTGDAKPKDPKNNETVVSAVIITNEDPDPVVAPKAGIPTLDKKITGVEEGTVKIDGAVLDKDGQAAVAKVGSKVSYELDSIVPDLTGYTDYTFVIGDSISAGLTYDKDSFVLKINDEEVAIDPDFATDDKSFTLTIPYATLSDYDADDTIVLTYKCTVNKNALSYDYDNNTADLTYSHSPYDDDTNKTPEDKTYVININLDVTKVSGDSSKTPLPNAEFKLYRENGTTKEFYKWANDTVTWVSEANAQVFKTNAQGALIDKVQGLDKGTYYLLETKAPEGYNLLPDPVEITISVTEANNKVTYTANNAVVSNGDVDLTAAQNANQPLATATIENESGAELPSTGGIGTIIFYVVGSILVIGAGIMLVARKRMHSN